MFCTNCGKEIMDGASFCIGCGTKVNSSVEPKEQVDFKKDTKSGVLIAVLIGIAAVLFMVIAVGGIFLISGKADSLLEKLAGKAKIESRDDDDDDKKDDKNHSDDNEIDSSSDENNKEPVDDIVDDVETVIEEIQNVNILIRQVDNTNFPEVVIYASVVDENNNSVNDVDISDFKITEINSDGKVMESSIGKVEQVLSGSERINMQLVLDASASMSSYGKMDMSKKAAIALTEKLGQRTSDRVSVISFDDYVYLVQDFTSARNDLSSAINSIQERGNTALYDGIYAGLMQTYYETGVKCVIALTDGAENCSSYTFDDVVNLAKQTAIPVFIIGVGDYGYDASEIQVLASECSGRYYSADEQNLDIILEDIYSGIYKEQQDYYMFSFTSQDSNNLSQYRRIVLENSDKSKYRGSYEREYVPISDMSGDFSSTYANKDFMFDFSSDRAVTDADVLGMSLAELRIARNEIFARHGRQFNDAFLNKWFYSKTWYLSIPQKYSPSYFDANKPSPMSALEIANIDFISMYEKAIIANYDIFPDATTVLLSEYDLNLSKANLKTALAQVQQYPAGNIRNENIRLITEAIEREDVQY